MDTQKILTDVLESMFASSCQDKHRRNRRFEKMNRRTKGIYILPYKIWREKHKWCSDDGKCDERHHNDGTPTQCVGNTDRQSDTPREKDTHLEKYPPPPSNNLEPTLKTWARAQSLRFYRTSSSILYVDNCGPLVIATIMSTFCTHWYGNTVH